MKSLRVSPVSVSKPGDVIGFSGANIHSDIINLTTYGLPRWSISHVGIVAEYEGELLIFESTVSASIKCVIQNAYVRGTQAFRVNDRVDSYRGRVWSYPLTNILSLGKSYRLTNYLSKGIGRPYDDEGAMRAGARLWADIQAFLHEESLSSLFCSEWVAAALRHNGLFDTDHAGRWSPNALVRALRRRGVALPPRRLK